MALKNDLAILKNWQPRKTGNPDIKFFFVKIPVFMNVVSVEIFRPLSSKLWIIAMNGGGGHLKGRLMFKIQIRTQNPDPHTISDHENRPSDITLLISIHLQLM